MRAVWALILGAGLAGALPAAYSRLEGPYSLIAGQPAPGLKDGDFLSAQFRSPAGLAFDGAGRRLYVIDRGNQALRSMNLGLRPLVRTERFAQPAPKDPRQMLVLGAAELLFREASGSLKRFVKSEGAWAPAELGALPSKALWIQADPDGGVLGLDGKGAAWHWQHGQRRTLALGAASQARAIAASRALQVAWDPESGVAWWRSTSPTAAADWLSLPQGLKGVEHAAHRPGQGRTFEAVLLWSGSDCRPLELLPNGALEAVPTLFLGGLESGAGACPAPGPVGFAYDAAEKRMLLAVAQGNAIYSLADEAPGILNDPQQTNSHSFQDFDGPLAKPEGQRRILVIGSSTIFFHRARALVYPKRLEAELNQSEALAGSGRNWRVAGRGAIGSALGGGTLALAAASPAEELDAWGADWALVSTTTMTLAMDVLAFGRTSVEDDLASPVIDAEMALRPLEERPLGPHSMQLLKWVFKNHAKVPTLMPKGDDGVLRFNEFGSTAEYRALFNAPENEAPSKAILKKALLALKQRLESPRRRVAIVLDPMRQEVSRAEVQNGKGLLGEEALGDALPLQAWVRELCAEIGLPVLDPAPAFRLLAPSHFPAFNGEDIHYSDAGAALMGRILSGQLLELDRSQAAKNKEKAP